VGSHHVKVTRSLDADSDPLASQWHAPKCSVSVPTSRWRRGHLAMAHTHLGQPFQNSALSNMVRTRYSVVHLQFLQGTGVMLVGGGEEKPGLGSLGTFNTVKIIASCHYNGYYWLLWADL
jgi:hypothetical protein